MRKFNTIKKSRKKSKDIDEKIEYLNKECQRTGLNEITMSTSGIYSVLGKEENPAHTTFTDATCNGQPFAMTSTNGLSIGGATTDENGFSFAPDGSGPATSYRGISSGFQPSKPGYQRSPEHRKIGAFLWYWNGSSYARLEWKFNNQNVDNSGQWAQWKQGAFTPFLDPIIGDASFDPACLAAVIAAGGGGAFPDPDEITPPNNPVLFKNDLGDPSHLPVNLDGMSPEAYNTILDKARRDKVDRIARTGRYPNASEQKFLQDYLNNISDPIRQQSERMRIFKLNGVWFPLADAGSAGEPVSDIDINTGLGAQDGDEIAFFGGGNNKNTPPPPPTRRTKRGTADAQKANSGMYPSMTPEKFKQKYGISWSEYLKLP